MLKYKLNDIVKVVKPCDCPSWGIESFMTPCKETFGKKAGQIMKIEQCNTDGRIYYVKVNKGWCRFKEDQLEFAKITQYEKLMLLKY